MIKKSIIKELTLYRYRYLVGYSLFVAALVGMLFIAGSLAPGALSQQEIDYVSTSTSFDLTDITVLPIVDLPYHLLQRASIKVLGLSELAIKLPSLIVGLLTGVGLLLLLRQWFTQNVAIITAIIAISASQFLAIAQGGTATIMLIFWSMLLLLLATYVTRHGKQPRKGFGWKLLFFVGAALSLYTPLSIYIVIVMLSATLLHPHLRYVLRQLSYFKLAACVVAGSILLLPLAWHLTLQPQTTFTLLGLPQTLPDGAAIWSSVQYLLHALLGFMQPGIRFDVLIPLYGMSAAALILLGVLQLIVDRHSARSYTIGIWFVVLGIILLLQPQLIAVAFIPMMLLLAIGINTLYQRWYGLFPKNPYARIVALLPLAVLMGGIVFTGLDRYTGSYTYSTNVAETYSHDLSLIRQTLRHHDISILVIPSEQHVFYANLQKQYPDLAITDALPNSRHDMIVAEPFVSQAINKFGEPAQLVVNSYQNEALRFSLY